MNRTRIFAGRCAREMWRDPLGFVFGIGFPIALLTMMKLLSSSLPDMPADVFGTESFTPGMAVFGLSFLMIFLGSLVCSDRSGAFLMRMYASPLRPVDYLLGYTLPALPIALLESAVCLGWAMVLGLRPDLRMLLMLAVLLPTALLYIFIGLLLGIVLPNSGAVGGISSLLINAAAWLSGTWFPLELTGRGFGTFCNALPFVHSVNAAKAALSGDLSVIPAELAWVLGYALAIFTAAALIFRRRMKE